MRIDIGRRYEKRDWAWYKTFIIQIRGLQNRLTRQGNRLMIALSVVDEEARDMIIFYPHGINLKTGIVSIAQDSEGFRHNINIRALLEAKKE